MQYSSIEVSNKKVQCRTSTNTLLSCEIKQQSLMDKYLQNYAKDFKNLNKNKNKHKLSDIIIKNKEDFRQECVKQLPIIRNIIIEKIPIHYKYETILIECRILPHLEYLIRNMIIKLPEWSHTIVCGLLNYDYMNNICNKISSGIRIIKLPIENLNPSSYSKLLLSLDFWDYFNSEKVLIYQEDSIIFNNKIDSFLKYDYIGAPWPKRQDDNAKLVGNGGFSLRTRYKMIDCIKNINPHTLTLGKSTLNYMKNAKLTYIPEDVFFSKCMIDFHIGNVADWEIARSFSQETQVSDNPLGGHQFWLAGKNLNNYFNHFKKVGILSHYPWIVGGGEKYISDIIKFFIHIGSTIYFFNNTEKNKLNKTNNIFFNKDELLHIKHEDINKLSDYIEYFDIFLEMGNTMVPTLKTRMGKMQIFHCQFPFNYKYDVLHHFDIEIKVFDKMIVNSDYTYNQVYKYYKHTIDTYYKNQLYILYPNCFDTLKCSKKTDKIIFTIIGRIFKPMNEYSKNIDKMINLFNKIDCRHIELYIIGTVQDEDYFYYLYSLIKTDNIFIKPNISTIEKNILLEKSNYIINAMGMGLDETLYAYAYEHFGIALIEAMSYKCIPISCNGGFPRYYIENNINGYLFDNEIELYDIIMNIVKKKTTMNNQLAISINNKLIEQFNYKHYMSNLSNIISI